MATNINTIKADGLKAVGNRVLVVDMYFGDQKTKGGIILTSDDGKERGIYPRWGRVYHKGPDNNDDYDIGDWVLVEHGRWTRGVKIEIEGNEEIEIRMVEAESILAYSDTKPNAVQIGHTTAHGTVKDMPTYRGAV